MISCGSAPRNKSSLTCLLAVAAAALGGCSGGTSADPQSAVSAGSAVAPLSANDASTSSFAVMDVRSRRKIYIVGGTSNMLTTYTLQGKPAAPTIAGLDAPVGLAVDAHGKIYVANSGSKKSGRGSITTYDADGSRTTPTITASLDTPWGIAVDARGKIYVANYNGGTVTTYLPDGSKTTPTISGLKEPTAVAVDRNGKIYVTQKGSSATGSLTTYSPNGKPTTPTITTGIDIPQAVAVDARERSTSRTTRATPSRPTSRTARNGRSR